MTEARLILKIITPDGALPEELAAYVVLPTTSGQIGVLPRHISLITSLEPGVITYRRRPGGDLHRVATGGGFADVSNDEVRVLADSAEAPEDIDVDRARRALQRAERRLQEKPSGLDVVRARASLERAVTRLKVAGALQDESEVS